MDNLIESLKTLIEKKKKIKIGAMQELLTGKRRLPGFTEKWTRKELREVLSVCHGKSQHEVESRAGKYPILATGGDIGKAKAFIYNEPSVLIGRKGTIDNPIYIDTPFWCIDTIFFTKISDNCSAKFIYYLFCLVDWYSHNEASGVPSLSAKKIESLDFIFPGLKEQQSIVNCLTVIDNEIKSTENKLAKYRNIKQGMMQQLLTGRIRLPYEKTIPEVLAPKAIDCKSTPKIKTIQFPAIQKQQGHNEHFHEAVVLSAIVALFATEEYPIGRVRRQKLAYLLHRYKSESTAGFLKKAAGPYNPTIRYKDEDIALKAKYVKPVQSVKSTGFVADENVVQAMTYFTEWYGDEAIRWLEQFRFCKTEYLEVLATTAEAISDLGKADHKVSLESVKSIIRTNKEWTPKLQKPYFSDENINKAIAQSEELFGL